MFDIGEIYIAESKTRVVDWLSLGAPGVQAGFINRSTICKNRYDTLYVGAGQLHIFDVMGEGGAAGK